MTRLLLACEGLGSLDNSSAVLAWNVILAVGHCLTGCWTLFNCLILHAILKNSKNVVSKLQLIPPELFPDGDHTWPLTSQESFLHFPVKINNGEKKRDEDNSCHFVLTSEELSWESGLWASPTVPADTLVDSMCAQSGCFRPAEPCRCPLWRWVPRKADPRAPSPEQKTVSKHLCWETGVFCWKKPLGVRNFMKETVFHIK